MEIREEFGKLVDAQTDVAVAVTKLEELLATAIVKRDQFETRAREHFSDRWTSQFPGVAHTLDSTVFKLNFDSKEWERAILLSTVGGNIYYTVSVGWFQYDKDLVKISCLPPIEMVALADFLKSMEAETGVKFILEEE